MFNNALPHHSALRAMVIAICLPIVLFMFLTVRTRQLQSTANPRWAQFAKVTGPSASALTVVASPFHSPITAVEAEVVKPRPQESNNHDSETMIREFRQPEAPDVSIDSLQPELVSIRQRLDQLTQLQTEHQAEDDRLGAQLVNLLNSIRDVVSNASAANLGASNKLPDVVAVMNQEPEINIEDLTTCIQFTTESIQEIDLRQFLNKFGEFAQITILSGDEPQAKTEKPGRIPMTLHHAHVSPVSNEAKYFLHREGNEWLICTADEATRLKPEQMYRIVRVRKPNGVYGPNLNPLLPIIMKGLVNVSNSQVGQELSERSARGDGNISISRQALARALYESAAITWQSGDQEKARHQIEASLRHNNDDVDAIRLKNEMIQISAQDAAR